MLPSISTYGKYESDNYGAHTLKVNVGSLTLYYSYHTVVAYNDFDDGKVVCENVWGVTTGKHLNWIDNGNKKNRVESEKFNQMLKNALARHTN